MVSISCNSIGGNGEINGYGGEDYQYNVTGNGGTQTAGGGDGVTGSTAGDAGVGGSGYYGSGGGAGYYGGGGNCSWGGGGGSSFISSDPSFTGTSTNALGTSGDGSITVTYQTTDSPPVPATNVTVAGDGDSITATTPAGAAGLADVIVTNPDTGTATLVSGFTYIEPPTISSVSPNYGTAAGGTGLTITGTNFEPGVTVDIGNTTSTYIGTNEFVIPGQIEPYISNLGGQSDFLPTVTRGAGNTINISGNCSQAYFVVMIYRNQTDYRFDRLEL